MLTRWPIRNKLLTGIGLLLVIVGALGWSGFHGLYAYRSLVNSLNSRAAELPLASALSQHVATLRITIGEVRGGLEVAKFDPNPHPLDKSAIGREFSTALAEIHQTLEDYRTELGGGNNSGRHSIDDSKQEWLTVSQIDECLASIDAAARGEAWVDDDRQAQKLDTELQRLQTLAVELPGHLYGRILQLKGEVHSQYHAWIVLTWVTSIATVPLLVLFIRLFYSWVFRPLRVLVKGSRRVAAGEFGYRIALHTHDEMSELADALNDMTARFQAIRDDLDRQVQERTKQVVRSEQLASVGFLAAGVAHEINNPLASIAMCAESLESRLQDLSTAPAEADRQVIRTYLQMIQNEAFRCKGITERLLDFSRVGETRRQNTDLRELVEGVIAMVGHLEKYQGKLVEFAAGQAIFAPVNPQQIKQVVLNLITNALDSVTAGGRVVVEVRDVGNQVQMTFTDNGCGLSDEVREHLFEPFFTRRRTGQGIGLGLSITYRIIADHEGHIEVHSDGPDRGSQFRVVLPAADKQKEQSHRYQAA